MQVFDKVSQKTIDRRDQQLSFLALFMVVVLGGGMALMMYPMVFNRAAVIPVAPSKTLFFGFCALCILMVMYLIHRMRVVKTLRANLSEEREQSAKILQTSSAELLGTLMGFSHFQDRLTMDFRRAAQVNEPLSLLLVQVKPAKLFAEGLEKEVALGDAARVLSRKLRKEDSLYRLSSDFFAVMLPGTTEEVAKQTSQRFSEGLTDAAGASNRYTSEIKVVNYPAHVNSASEMEREAYAIAATE
jgi:GGDEF domain-containing protein